VKIAIVTPAAAGSRTGNRHTAQRWATMLRAAGHKVGVASEWNAATADVLVALHARRSHASVVRYRQAYPEGNLVVVLTGTDLYRDIRYDSGAQLSMKLAQRLVVLQDEGLKELPRQFRAKTRVIYQSAQVKARAIPPKKTFRVCVLGHLREEKDPFRGALALQLIPPEEKIELLHLGSAMTAAMAEQAKALMVHEPRYRWPGSLPHWHALRWLRHSHLMVISSRMEGGANVIAEAVCAGVPVLASAISGNIGMLGSAYPGYFPLGDETALAKLLMKAMRHQAYYQSLRREIAARQHLFRPQSEQAGLTRLLREFA
jgi:putative glycosyltransferase (TIGR04348 family)